MVDSQPQSPGGGGGQGAHQGTIEQRYKYPSIQPVPYINDKSRKLAMQRRPLTATAKAKQSVHLRLYQQDLEKTRIYQAK
jgi:hypothetical protein